MVTIIDVKLSPDDRRALARAATKAALAAGMSLEEWQAHRAAAPDAIGADVLAAFGSEPERLDVVQSRQP